METSIKNIYARNNHIKLLRIPYFRFNEIEDILLNKKIRQLMTNFQKCLIKCIYIILQNIYYNNVV